jgi:predicted dehydrogenase
MNSNATHPPRIALIGVSGYGRIHLQLLRECQGRGEVDFAAAVVINPREETATIAELQGHGCVIYDSYEEMLRRERGRIDLCMIPTGIHWHARMTVDALHAGANVLVEKPLAATAADVAAVRRAEQAAARFVAVGFQDYYERGTQWLKEQIHAGTIGELQTVRFLGIWPRPRGYYLRNNWAGRLQTDGRMVLDSPLNNAFAHFGMLALYFSGQGRDEAAAARIVDAELHRAHAIESFDTAVVRLQTARGVRIWLGVSHCCRPQFEPEIRLTGTRGTACWNYENEAWVKPGDGPTLRHTVADITGARREMMAAVLARLRDPAVPVCSPEIARHHSQFIADLHARWTIRTVDRAQVEWSEDAGAVGAVPIVRGLEEAMHQAYARQAQLHECGFVLAPNDSAS